MRDTAAETDIRDNLGLLSTPNPSSSAVLEQHGVTHATRFVLANPALVSLGMVNSFYEAALHVFVFMWTPLLESRGPTVAISGVLGSFNGTEHEKKRKGTDLVSAVPHGMVFSLFMACKMAGSLLFALVGDRVPANYTLRFVFIGGAVAFLIPLVSGSYTVALLAFCSFEFGLGLYWPAMAVMRAELVPNHFRATMTSVFRVPLNVLVMACLAFSGHAGEEEFLMMCFTMMTVCLALNWHAARTSVRLLQ